MQCVAVSMMTNSFPFDGLSKRHRKNQAISKKAPLSGAFLFGTATRIRPFLCSMEMWLRGLCVLGHFGVNNLAERIRIKWHAAVIAIFWFEAARVTAHVRHASLL